MTTRKQSTTLPKPFTCLFWSCLLLANQVGAFVVPQQQQQQRQPNQRLAVSVMNEPPPKSDSKKATIAVQEGHEQQHQQHHHHHQDSHTPHFITVASDPVSSHLSVTSDATHHTTTLPQPSVTASEATATSTTTPTNNNKKNSPMNYWLDPTDLDPPTWTMTSSSSNKKVKYLNLFGIWTAVVSLVVSPPWILAMTLVDWYQKTFNAEEYASPTNKRIAFDTTGKLWSKAWLWGTNSYPTQSGQRPTLAEGQACLFVANHASWLDIPVLCATALDDTPFKFIAKGELTKLPGIGQQLEGGKHITIDREDRRSQLRTFKEGMKWLKSGVPLMAFPEGKRSTQQGRLMDFKGGIFSMAIKTGVPIVPISLSNTHAVFPAYALMPVQPGAGKLHVHIHDAIPSKGKTEAELSELVRAAFCSQLPECQLPLETKEEDTGAP